VAFLAYDLLEHEGEDTRAWPQWRRREQLDALIAAPTLPQTDLPLGDAPVEPHILPAAAAPLQLSPLVTAPDWATLSTLREESRSRGVEGFMLKRRDSLYGTGRTKDVGLWWKWKVDPLTIDAVLIYAQSGHGRRANLYTDYTFAVWDDGRLVPFAKAYSGLTDEEMRQVDQRIRQTTIEKFGPVRSVTPTLVVELGFEGIQASSRHKSGLAVRFPRMLRLRWDKPVAEADTLANLRELIPAPATQSPQAA
jgi:DNA ligase-1